MTSEPKIDSKLLSVVIPCYNQGHFAIEAISSVLDNDPNHICEIILVNDGSNDPKTGEILQNFSHPSVVIYNQENKGLAQARNKGIGLSTCDYLLFLDADNKITPEFIQIFETELRKGTYFDAIHGNSQYFGEKFDDEKFTFKSQPINIYKLSRGNYIDACAIIKKETILELGGYDENMPHMGLEDWDLWIRMAKKGKIVLYFDKTLFYYRFVSNSMIRTLGKRDAEVREYIVKKFDNVMFGENFFNENFPFANFDDLKTTEIVKRLFLRQWNKFFKR